MYKHGLNLDPAFCNISLTELITQITFPGSCASWGKPFEAFKSYGTISIQNKIRIFINFEKDYVIKKTVNWFYIHFLLSMIVKMSSGVPDFSTCTTIRFHDCFFFVFNLFFPQSSAGGLLGLKSVCLKIMYQPVDSMEFGLQYYVTIADGAMVWSSLRNHLREEEGKRLL